MEFILFMANLAWRLILIGLGFWVFKMIMENRKNIPETLSEIVATLDVAVKAGCLKLRRKIAENLRKEQKEEPEPTAEKAEGSVT